MAIYDDLKNIENEIIKCMNCGNCQAVCPIYKETLEETGVARGKIQLARALLEGKLEYTDKMAELLSLCLTCRACGANCPCGVQPEKIILATRAAMARKKGLPTLKRRIFDVLKRPKLFKFGMAAGSKFQGLGMKKVRGKNLASPRFPIGLDMRRVIPRLADTPLIKELPRVNKVDNPRCRVAFFTGCVNNYIYTDVGKSVVNVLLANDIEVVIPEHQHCCGIPTLMHGDLDTAKEIAKYNLNQLSKENVDYIVTACGTCGSALSHHYLDILGNVSGYINVAKKIGPKVYDISEFLVDVIDYKKPQGEVKERVTYHDPCHLVRGDRVVAKQPRKILKSIPGLEFIEMSKPDRCCGSAGSFSLTHYEMSSSIRNKKTDDIISVNPTILVTSCGACKMQLEDGLHQAGKDIPVVHVAQLLEKSYNNEI